MEQAKQEVLRYLGRRGQDIPPQVDSLIEECMARIRDCTPRHIHRIFDLRWEEQEIGVAPTQLLLPGAAIRRHLSGCRQAALMAATLGIEADNMIRRREMTDMTRALILDACATQYIERYCGEIEQRLCQEQQQHSLTVTARFSPGYGDLPLDIQPAFLAALDAERKLGLTCTHTFILLPRKSVTALIGIGKNLPRRAAGCSDCSLRHTCSFRRHSP